MTDGLYHSKAGSFVERIGLDSWLVRGYSELLYHATGDTVSRQVNGFNAVFRTETRAECQHLYGNFTSEEHILQDLVAELEEDDVFYDVGANVGLYTCFAAQICDSFAMEPFPKNVRRLQENLDLNDLDAGVRECAITDEDGETSFRKDSRGEAGSGLGSISGSGELEVEACRLSSLVQDKPAPTVVKIDVEGAEMEVLKGGEKVFREDCRTVYCEIHPEHVDATEVESLLEEYGFEVENMGGREKHPFLKAVRR
ncbi:MAG: FkbM family methyltransferase [Candidatus Nanohaloarchaea archaeon]